MSAELQADIRYLRQRGFDARAGIREALIAQAVGCVHAACMLVAALPEAASRAAVVRELKRFLPESVEQRAGELRPRSG